MGNRGLLAVIIVLLIGIVALIASQYKQPDQRTPIERVGDSLSDSLHKLGSEVDEQTDKQ